MQQAVRLGKIRRILVLNRIHIGDCLLTTPMLRALKRRFPRAHMAVSVPEANRDLLITNPHVDEIVVRPKIKYWGSKIQFALEQRRKGYDLIISLQEKSMFYAWTTAYISHCNPRRPVTIALDHPKTRRFYQHLSPVRPGQHEVYKYLDLAEMLGCPREPNPVLELEPTSDARKMVSQFVRNRGIDADARFIGINPGATEAQKRWPVERFAEVADRLHTETGLPIVIFGGPSDRELAAAIVSRMSHHPLVAAGHLSLAGTAALLERCHLLVTNDTGPMHMAVAMAVPVVAMFGPTSPTKFGPFTTLGSVIRHEVGCEDCVLPETEGKQGILPNVEKIVRKPPKAPRDRRNWVDPMRPPCIHTVSADECVEAALKLYSPPAAPNPSAPSSPSSPSSTSRRKNRDAR